LNGIHAAGILRLCLLHLCLSCRLSGIVCQGPAEERDQTADGSANDRRHANDRFFKALLDTGLEIEHIFRKSFEQFQRSLEQIDMLVDFRRDRFEPFADEIQIFQDWFEVPGDVGEISLEQKQYTIQPHERDNQVDAQRGSAEERQDGTDSNEGFHVSILWRAL